MKYRKNHGFREKKRKSCISQHCSIVFMITHQKFAGMTTLNHNDFCWCSLTTSAFEFKLSNLQILHWAYNAVILTIENWLTREMLVYVISSNIYDCRLRMLKVSKKLAIFQWNCSFIHSYFIKTPRGDVFFSVTHAFDEFILNSQLFISNLT